MKDKQTTNQLSTTVIYAGLHFLVDFCCAFFIFNFLGNTTHFYGYLFVYNFCAFALQMPVGLLADKVNRNVLLAAIGCVLTGTTFLLPILSGAGWSWNIFVQVIAVVLAGLGNCFFHIGGGIEILNLGGEKLTPLGIFVSPGAIGIYLGSILGKGENFILIPVAVILGGILLCVWNYITRKSWYSNNEVVGLEQGTGNSVLIAAILCLVLVVCLRSHLGMIFSFPWKRTVLGGILALCGVVGGKAAGGCLADKIGIPKAAFGSLALAALLFCFAREAMTGILGLFFFNMSMPITLFMASKLLNKSKGFAFGILTFAIFLGYLPVYFGYEAGSSFQMVLFSLISIVLLGLAYALSRRKWMMKPNKEKDGIQGR